MSLCVLSIVWVLLCFGSSGTLTPFTVCYKLNNHKNDDLCSCSSAKAFLYITTKQRTVCCTIIQSYDHTGSHCRLTTVCSFSYINVDFPFVHLSIHGWSYLFLLLIVYLNGSIHMSFILKLCPIYLLYSIEESKSGSYWSKNKIFSFINCKMTFWTDWILQMKCIHVIQFIFVLLKVICDSFIGVQSYRR